MSEMHHFEQVARPEPSYGRSARRYDAERELGRRVVEIIRNNPPPEDGEDGYEDWCADHMPAIYGIVTRLGLLGEEEVRP